MLLPASPPKRRRYTTPTPEVGWHTFVKQAAALEFADAHPPASGDPAAGGVQVWAQEKDRLGKRSYVVATRTDFWRRYRTLHPPFRHHYELIRTGRPCHLYFDLEFCRKANPDLDGERAVGTLREQVCASLSRCYPEDYPLDDCQVVDLESTTDAKFSRHLLFRLPGAAFADSHECGRFVHALCKQLAARRAAEPRLAELFVAPPSSSSSSSSSSEAFIDGRPNGNHPLAAPEPAARVCIVDLSVYSRNRCFRLYKSSKVGKVAQLLPAGLSEERLMFLPHEAETELFLSSLATNVPGEARLLRGPPSEEQARDAEGGDASEAAVSGTSAAGAAHVLIPSHPTASAAVAAAVSTAEVASMAAAASPATLAAALLPPVLLPRASSRSDWAPPLPPVLLGRPPRADMSAHIGATTFRSGECPLAPALVYFVLSAWTAKTGVTASARAWSAEPERRRLTLALAPSNRWCEHVQRQHRSNGTLLRVDLERAIFAQFCYDPDCRAAGFRGSSELPIPPALCAAASGTGGGTGSGGGAGDGVGAGADGGGGVGGGTSSAVATNGGGPTSCGCDQGWLSEKVLASMPLEELVAAHRRGSHADSEVAVEVEEPRAATAATAMMSDDSSTSWLVSDEALAAVEGV